LQDYCSSDDQASFALRKCTLKFGLKSKAKNFSQKTFIMANTIELVRQRLPNNCTDWLAFLFFLIGLTSVLCFEMFVVLPFVYDGHHDSTAMYWLHICAGLLIYFNAMANCAMLMVTDTGIRGVVLPSVLKPGWRFCSVCECNSPPRSFHCFTCKTCILKRDHHCNFAGVCVGHRNQRYFIVMVFYVALGAFYGTCMNVDFVFHLFGELSLKTVFCFIMPILAWMFRVVETVTMTMAFMISLCLITFLLTTALLGCHLINIYNGQLTYERARKITQYNVGLMQNIKSVFGEKWTICWLCPWISSPPLGDGLTFPEKNKLESSKSR
jgi:palmitoyltransferase